VGYLFVIGSQTVKCVFISSLKCPVSAHWKCLASTQRDEVLRAVREKDQKDWEASKSAGDSFLTAPKKRSELSIEQTTEFICGQRAQL